MPVATRVATDTGLRDAHASLQLRPYLRDLWSRREYMTFVARSELRSRQMTSVLGNLWHLLNPILQIIVYYLIFGLFLKVSRGVENYILFITVGVFIFSDIQRATMAGAGSMVNNRGLLQALSFPRAMLPVTTTVTETLATAPSLIVIYVVALISGEPPSWRWPLIMLVVVAQFWFNLGLALLAARAATHFNDIRQILPFIFRILIYASGVIFSVDAYAANSEWAWAFQANPIYCWLSISRWCIIGGELRGTWFLSVAIWTIVLLAAGTWWFRNAEHRYGRE